MNTLQEKKTEELLEQLDELEMQLYAYGYAQGQINFAGETTDPKGAAQDRNEALAKLYELGQKAFICDDTKELLEELSARKDELDELRQDQVCVMLRKYKEEADVPLEESVELTRVVNDASTVWHKAKDENDWDSFAPYLDKMVEIMVRIAKYKDSSKDAYNVWLDTFEPGSSTEFYDTFFGELKETIIPLVAQIQEAKKDLPCPPSFEATYDHDSQMQLARNLAELEGLNMNSLTVAESLHPFTDSVSVNNVFITTHIDESDVLSNVYSTLHEGGHALYEQNVSQDYRYTSLRGGVSMGIHESISRFFENIVGRSSAYAPHLLKALKKHFPEQLKDKTAEDLYAAINVVEPSLIRTEADELTYCLHIIIRYEIERMLFAGEIKAADVPEIWAQKYKGYLGIDVPDNTRGALQDTHWAIGALGYFPTYALGSALGAQYVAAMKREGLDVEEVATTGDLSEIIAWLKKHIFVFGSAKQPATLIQNACGESFSAHYYCDYLKNKYTAIYGL